MKLPAKILILLIAMAPLSARAELNTGGPASQVSINIGAEQLNELFGGLAYAGAFDLGDYYGHRYKIPHPQNGNIWLSISHIVNSASLVFYDNGTVDIVTGSFLWIWGKAPIFGWGYYPFTDDITVALNQPFIVTPDNGGQPRLQFCPNRGYEVKRAKLEVFGWKVANIKPHLMTMLKDAPCIDLGPLNQLLPIIPTELMAQIPKVDHNTCGLTLTYYVKRYEKNGVVQPLTHTLKSGVR